MIHLCAGRESDVDVARSKVRYGRGEEDKEGELVSKRRLLSLSQ